MLTNMRKRLLRAALALAFLIVPLYAAATDYTDIWYLPSESGWGVNLVQADNVIFATFFVYGTTKAPNGTSDEPTWYTAIIYGDASGNFSGNLYSTVGTYFAAPWVPGNVVNTLVGTASFVPSSDYQGTLTYSFTNGPTVVKSIQRQTLTTINLAGTYTGGRAGTYSGAGCGTPGDYQDNFNLQVLQPGNGSATFNFSYSGGLTCTLSGALTQYGQLYTIPSATYQCSNGVSTVASMNGIQATAQGIEGTYAAASAAAGCGESAAFAAVLVPGGSAPATQNVQPMIVNGGPADYLNLGFVSVKVCAPGSSTDCQTIDNILVDTGSSGLRLISTVLSPTLSLPQQVDAGGAPLAECIQFVDGFSWGSVRLADMQVAGEQAKSLPVQIIGDPAFASIPSSCSSSGPPENTVQTFGANGILGVGLMLQDCGGACAQSPIPGWYYGCTASGCIPTTVTLTQQLPNPVALFSVDNNGVIIALPSIPAAGAATATGSLIFGIGTQSNNGLGSASVLTTDPDTGTITTNFNGQNYTTSYLDSGSNFLYISTNLYPTCTGAGSGLYCPATTQSLSAKLEGGNNNASVSFSIANADASLGANPNFDAFDNLAASAGDVSVFAWGLPFFFGRNVYTAIETRSTPGGPGPYFAF
jgi:hypothetical protein